MINSACVQCSTYLYAEARREYPLLRPTRQGKSTLSPLVKKLRDLSRSPSSSPSRGQSRINFINFAIVATTLHFACDNKLLPTVMISSASVQCRQLRRSRCRNTKFMKVEIYPGKKLSISA